MAEDDGRLHLVSMLSAGAAPTGSRFVTLPQQLISGHCGGVHV
jgi:hypothetical protein